MRRSRDGRGVGAEAAAALLCVLAALAPAGAQTPTRSVALVDFAVRSPAGDAETAGWLGPAVSELVQAKMQLFGGARVLERQRMRALLHEARAAAGDDPGALAAVIPAEVLVGGSVNIDPKDPRRIRVQARAFETETAKIVSDAAFSGTGDLAGLLKIAEDVAKALADGLKLSYTPEQLAYAEPAKIDALRLFLEGEAHLASGRHGEAIASLQRALEGNEGRYYAAAHRLQGEAYQALARASAGEEERAVREEYLKKFRDDALAASGALFDLGLAYEANGAWREAIGAYRDYVDAVGAEGERVLWRVNTARLLEPRFPPGAQGAGHADLGRVIVEEEERIHFVASYGYRQQGKDGVTPPVLVTLEARTGEVARRLPLSGLLGAAEGEEPGPGGVVGVAGSRVVVWGKTGRRHVVAAVGPSGEVPWRHDLGEIAFWNSSESRLVGKGLVACLYNGPSSMLLDALDPVDGALRARIVLPTGAKTAGRGWDLDPVSARLRILDGSYSLEDGSFTPRGGGPVEPGEAPRETGIPGLSYTSGERGTRFFRDGTEVAFVERYRPPWQGVFPIRPGDPIPLHSVSGNRFGSADPRALAVTEFYRDYKGYERLDAASPALLLFRLDPVHGSQDPRYDLPLSGAGTVYNLLDAATGEVAAKFTWPPGTWQVQFLGRDLLFTWRELVRLRVPTRRDVIVTPLPEVRLRIAHCLFAAGDAAGAEQALGVLEGVLPGDPRVGLLRLRLALRQGSAGEAAGYALRTLASGALAEDEAAEALAAVRGVRPEVRDLLRVPVRAVLLFRGLTDAGILVAGPAGSIDTHLVIDTRRKTSTVLRTPELLKNASLLDPWPAVAHRGRHLFGFAPHTASTGSAATPGDAGRIAVERIDLHRGVRATGSPFPHGCRSMGFLPGVGLVAEVSCGTDGGGFWRVDPENLATERITATTGRLFLGPEVAVVVAPHGPAAGKAAFAALDRRTGGLLREGEVELRDERIVEATADREGIVFAIAGGVVAGGAKTWVRVAVVPLGPGASPWSYTADGVLGGNVVIDGEKVSFPAFEGDPFSGVTQGSGASATFLLAAGGLPLRRVSLDRRDGIRIGAEEFALFAWNQAAPGRRGGQTTVRPQELTETWPYKGAFAPLGPRWILPGAVESVVSREGANFPTVELWRPAPGLQPVGVEPAPPGEPGRVLVRFSDRSQGWFDPGTMLVDGNTVYESLGGGTLLVKDFAGGAGLERLLGPPMEDGPGAGRHPP